MDYKNQQEILKKNDLAAVTLESKQNEAEVVFTDTLKFLRKFAKFLIITKGQGQNLVMGSDLAEISEAFLNCNEHVIVDIEDIYQRIRLELSKDANGQIDINTSVLQLLTNCLLYIINVLQDENPNVQQIFNHFLYLKKCIFTFSTSSAILDNIAFKHLVSCWISDLLKIITGADGIPRNCPKHLKVFNVIKQILSCLARCSIYRHLILGEITKKFECALSYYAVNKEFSTYIASKTTVFEYLLWIMKTVIHDFVNEGCTLDDGQAVKIRQTLETLEKCLLDGKSPSVIRNLVGGILQML